MTFSSSDQVYLRRNVQFEPLYHGWYAWYLTVPPVTAALNLAERYLPIMKTYVASPAMHAAACRNPAMKGGPFIDLDGQKVAEIRELIERTTERAKMMLAFAKAFKELQVMLQTDARGLAMDEFYKKIPDVLRGYIELYYDLNNSPSFRVCESLLYDTEFYDIAGQSISLSLIDASRERRPFLLSTPRLPTPEAIELTVPFCDTALDQLFAMRATPATFGEIVNALGVTPDMRERFATLFTTEALQIHDARNYHGEDVRIRYFGHACVLIQSGGISVLIDAVVSYDYPTDLPRYTFSDLPEHIDYVLITHSHHDHIILETLIQLRHKIGTVIVSRNVDGLPHDPSLQLALRRLGFADVREVRDYDRIPMDGGEITIVPFLGEHNDLAIQSKCAYHVRFGERSILAVADACNLDPRLYRHLFARIGQPDILFIGMETEGAPPSWVYGPFFSKPLPREINNSRRARGCKIDEARTLVDTADFSQVYVYALGQEPWLAHILGNDLDEDSASLRQTHELVAFCRERGKTSEYLYAQKEVILCQP